MNYKHNRIIQILKKIKMISIKDFIVEQLSKTSIFEIALSREDFIRRLDGLSGQLIENWCLIRYCTITNQIEYKTHWRSELRTHINNILAKDVKVDRKRTIEFEYLKNSEYNNPENIYKIISVKWYKENLDIDSTGTSEVVNDFVSYGIYELIDILANKKITQNELIEYIETI